MNPGTYFGTRLQANRDYVWSADGAYSQTWAFQLMAASTPTITCRPARPRSTTVKSTSPRTAASNGGCGGAPGQLVIAGGGVRRLVTTARHAGHRQAGPSAPRRRADSRLMEERYAAAGSQQWPGEKPGYSFPQWFTSISRLTHGGLRFDSGGWRPSAHRSRSFQRLRPGQALVMRCR